ncbi:11443_t:CDS:2 [Gigaspora margarita]|uniref:11443_t:CDS:1 n=1 Tax=Gigaspora margarita TaxID=4874 RepID=A0ABN7WKK4_GIGMA|nr:11443_t:CDS:2 [Gigaspora margarita]
MSSNKRKEKTILSNQQRKEVIAFKKTNLNISHVDLVDWVKKNMGLDVHLFTIGRLIKNKDNIKDNLLAKRQKTAQYPNFENLLLDVIYESSDNAWMIILFQNWFKAFDLKIAGCKTLLLMDGTKVHSYSNLNLQNTTIHIYLPYTTSQLFEDIEALYFRNMIDLEEYINYPEESEEIVNLSTNLELENDSNEDDDSTEIYRAKHNEALSSLQKAIRKL